MNPRRKDPRTAGSNRSVQVGLAFSRIGGIALKNTLIAASVLLHSAICIEQSANKVSEIITHLYQQDMAAQQKHLLDINETCGLALDTPFHAEAYGHYNNPLRSGGGRTPFQPATQAVNTILKNVKEKQQYFLYCHYLQ